MDSIEVLFKEHFMHVLSSVLACYSCAYMLCVPATLCVPTLGTCVLGFGTHPVPINFDDVDLFDYGTAVSLSSSLDDLPTPCLMPCQLASLKKKEQPTIEEVLMCRKRKAVCVEVDVEADVAGGEGCGSLPHSIGEADGEPQGARGAECAKDGPAKTGTQKRKRHKKGEPGHQEWVRDAFETLEETDEYGRVVGVKGWCLFCRRQGGPGKPHHVQRPGGRSASWSGPKYHLKSVHGIGTPEELRAELSKPWGMCPNNKKIDSSAACYIDEWGPGTIEWDRAVSNTGKLISVMNLPFTLAERPPFIKFMRQFVPNWPAISRQTVTRSVEKQSNRIVDAIKDEMATVTKKTSVAMTCDIWTSRAGEGYLTSTMHWIDESWTLRRNILGERHC